MDSPGLGYQGSLFLQSGVPHRSRAGGSTPDCLPRWPQHAPLQGLSPDGRRHPATHPSRSRRRGCRTAHSPPETAEKVRSNRKSHKLRRPPPAEWSPQARSAPSRKPAVPAAPEAGQTRKQHTGQTLGRSGCLGDHCCVLPGLPEARGLLRLQRPVLCAWLGDWSSAKSFPEKRKALTGDHRARTGLLESTLRRVHAHTARHTHRLAAAHSLPADSPACQHTRPQCRCTCRRSCGCSRRRGQREWAAGCSARASGGVGVARGCRQSQELQRELSLAHGEPPAAETSSVLSGSPRSRAGPRLPSLLQTRPSPILANRPQPLQPSAPGSHCPSPRCASGMCPGAQRKGGGGDQSLCTEALALSSPFLIRDFPSTCDPTPKPQTFRRLH